MLIRFSVSNFLSFNYEQEFSMIAGKVRTHPAHLEKGKKLNLLKFTAVYGTNASGKSNLVNAMDFARTVIVQELPTNTANSYCRTSPKNKDLSSKFEFEIKIKNNVYAYGFDIILSSNSIVGEWLYELSPDNKESEIFTRKPQESYVHFADKFKGETRKTLETYARDNLTNDSVLYLTEMNRNKTDLYTREKTLLPLKNVYQWFKSKLVINYPETPMSPAYFMEGDNLQKVNSIISKLGLGVNEIEIVDGDMEDVQKHMPPAVLRDIVEQLKKEAIKEKKKERPDENHLRGGLIRGDRVFFILTIDPQSGNPTVKKLLFKHKVTNTEFEIDEESDGTRRLLDLLELVISAKTGTEKVYVIDEINRCLHPQVTYRLISEYLDSINTAKIQLIVTTHEAHLMDLNLVRRDEIWFVEKSDIGESRLYSLDNYNERFDKKIRRAYLDGRYGGVPLFDDYYPMMQEDE